MCKQLYTTLSVAKMAILLEHERYTSIRIAIIASKNNSSANGFRSGRCTGAKQLDEWFNGFSFCVVVIEIEQIDSCEESEVRRCADCGRISNDRLTLFVSKVSTGCARFVAKDINVSTSCRSQFRCC